MTFVILKVRKKLTRTFKELGLSAEILKALEENRFKMPFPIQEAAIPYILKGMDVIGQAHTGTGKTDCFFVTIIDKVKTQWTYSSFDIGSNQGIGNAGNKRDQ